MITPVKFDHPPVVEVVCGVLFASPGPIETSHIGGFWERIKPSFPQACDVPPLPVVLEHEVSSMTEIEWGPLPPLRRTWLASEHGDKVIQIQQDRFLFNWKQTLNQDKYPSYEVIRDEFEAHLKEFMGFLIDVGVSEPSVRQYELTYVNHIAAANGLKEVGRDQLFVDHLRQGAAERFLPEPESFNWRTSYCLPDGGGRLHFLAQTAVSEGSGEKIVRLDMTARGFPTEATEAARKSWFDMAHVWITHGFTDATSEKLHKKNIWERTA